MTLSILHKMKYVYEGMKDAKLTPKIVEVHWL